MTDLESLLEIIQQVAAGNYSNDIMSLTGPETPEPIRTIAESMGMMMVKVEAREYHLEMLIAELKRLNETIRQNTVNTVSAMARALAARDAYTEGHTERVGFLAEQIAREMGLPQQEIDGIRLGGQLHDIGKIGFPDALFQPHEAKNPPHIVARIMQHPAVGAEILSGLDFLGPAIDYVRCHHERPDGKGYPCKLADPEIPIGAKIIAVADSFDAMTTERPYQKAMTPDAAMGIFKKFSGLKWDSECVAALDRHLIKHAE
ncbi:MAG: HD-GYP domain-containing protein [Desulfatirhabdiaceae bacterium]